MLRGFARISNTMGVSNHGIWRDDQHEIMQDACCTYDEVCSFRVNVPCNAVKSDDINGELVAQHTTAFATYLVYLIAL